MDKYALVKNGIVQTTIETDNPQEFPDIVDYLVKCDETVKDNYAYDGQEFSRPVRNEEVE